MKIAFVILPLLGSVAACRPPPAPEPSKVASPVAFAAPSAVNAIEAPPAGVASSTGVSPAEGTVATNEAAAIAKVSALPEVQALASAKSKLVVSVVDPAKEPCDTHSDKPCPSAGEIEIIAGFEYAGETTQALRFFVSPASGDIDVDAGFGLASSPEPRRLRYAVWARLNARRLRAIGIIADLPEVVAWRQVLERHDRPDDPESLGLWTEVFAKPDCTGAGAECAFTVYVGARHSASIERWNYFTVNPEARKIAVLVDSQEQAYDTWKASKPVARFFEERHPTIEFRRLDGPFPVLASGRGDLGYGAPDKVVGDTATWAHPIKQALAERGFVLTRVELYLGATYPAFFVRPIAGRPALFERASKDPWEVRLAAHALLAANGGLAFELVEDASGERSRYRYRGRDRTFERLVAGLWKML
ncbi:hypothetical protein [Polyangium sorediatum]|uniref:Lipoprotein n=1 Tax=Polyangium sorediatum TaxID=889274 RepID=A0ABT6P0Z6_9BACT|nr:hypothetical protein [Polyangium sorediatum]MDI1434057.1 hypothetical protein [Polyangium sorediatum]